MVAGGAGAAAFGGYDDLAGGGDRRGFRGHLGALASGEVTTGAVKLGGIGAAGVVAAALAGGSPADVIINAGLTAGGANLLNLFDLRPGRAIKVALAGGALLGAAGGPGGRAAAHDFPARVPCGVRRPVVCVPAAAAVGVTGGVGAGLGPALVADEVEP